MSPRRRVRIFVPVALRVRLATRRWEKLAAEAGLEETCDARMCAKLAKARKHVWRSERRSVRRLLKEAA